MFLGHLRPEWLRYRIAEPLVQKKLLRKLSSMPPDVIVSDIFLVSSHENHNQNGLPNDTGEYARISFFCSFQIRFNLFLPELDFFFFFFCG